MMSQREMVMKLWSAKSNLSKMKLDLEDCARELRNWQLERMSKGLPADPNELIDSVSLAWQSSTLAIAIDQISKVHERLESNLIINEI